MTSQINPNNIDGNYPVAGQPNNTQGMRDNFTNTKTNLQFAADEISDLQSKVVLKAALTGTTLDNNMNGALITNVTLNDVGYTELQLTQTSGSVVLDYSAGMYQAMPTTSGNVSLDFANWPVSGTAGALRFAIVITSIAYTLTLPATVNVGIKAISGISPGTPGVSNTITFAETGTYIFEFLTSNSGTNISIQDLVRPATNYQQVVTISNTTPSVSKTTGALVVAGGAGVSGNVYANAFYGDGSTLSNIYPNYLFNGTSYIGIGSANGNANISVAGTSNVVVVTSSQVQVNGTGGIALTDGGTVGYSTGAGGTIAQSGNKSGTVVLNKPSGEITMQNTALGGGAIVSFVLTNSTISNHDTLVLNHVSGGTLGAYTLNASCNTGNATIYVRNATAGSLSEAVVLRYAVIKGSIA